MQICSHKIEISVLNFQYLIDFHRSVILTPIGIYVVYDKDSMFLVDTFSSRFHMINTI